MDSYTLLVNTVADAAPCGRKSLHLICYFFLYFLPFCLLFKLKLGWRCLFSFIFCVVYSFIDESIRGFDESDVYLDATSSCFAAFGTFIFLHPERR